MIDDLDARLVRAIASPGSASSDFDLNRDLRPAEGRRLRQAAVLVGITGKGDAAQVILTKRSSALRHHPGQIAFAGGRIDPTDDGPVAAALREAREEIGLHSDMVRVLGTMSSHETVSDYSVTPVIARISDGFRPVAEPGEVEEIFTVPLSHLMRPENYTIQARDWLGHKRRYFVVPWGPYYIWGATARMLRALAQALP